MKQGCINKNVEEYNYKLEYTYLLNRATIFSFNCGGGSGAKEDRAKEIYLPYL